ncbi:Cytochrome P450 monooxygenase BOT4 [Apiospora phragmitis]|uniref:Cytochrome P450 monooxygenase BOT4 n=1 Tax=Apiospora phragmitis TaxID=2905665 RepID=A0ABR1WTB0_9PEZI
MNWQTEIRQTAYAALAQRDPGLSLLLGITASITLALCCYSYFLHPLANVPGPKLAAVSPLWMMRSLHGKHLNRDIKRLHDHYGEFLPLCASAGVVANRVVLGDIVRVGPNTVSFATTVALTAVHNAGSAGGSGKEAFTKKGTIEWLLVEPQAHEKLRKAVQPAFTIRELRKQEAIQQNWITAYHERLDFAAKEGAEINITEHISQLTWDMLTLQRTDRGHDFLSAIVGTERKGIHLTQDELQSNAAMLVMVGQDATVTCLSSTLYFLLRDPRQMARLRDELSAAFAREGDITGEAIARRPFLNGAISEAMRLISPANGTGMHRQSQGGYVEGVWVPTGVTMAVDQYTIQRSPKYWKHPEEYRPERWFDRGPGSDF